MKSISWAVEILAGLLATVGCSDSPQVLQGTVQSYERSSKTITIRSENPPEQELTISLEEADIGAQPKVGDMVRVAYRERRGKLMAIRLMNLSQQEELKKKGH